MERFERRNGRHRGAPINLERLEGRELLSYSPFGFSLPDLTVTGVSAPTAAYGQTLTVQVDVHNIGASSMYEPYALEPGAFSTADAPPSEVGVYASTSRHFRPGDAIFLGEIDIPFVVQNSTVTVVDTVVLPDFGPGLPREGKTLYIFFEADTNNVIAEVDETNNFQLKGVPVVIQPPLPELSGVVFDVPRIVQPGDSLRPTIKIANFGTVDPAAQAPVLVYLVASTDEDFGPGDTILADFLIEPDPITGVEVRPLSDVPLASPRALQADIVTIYNQPNVVTLVSPQVTTPTEPGEYFVGVIIDPNEEIVQISDLNEGRSSRLFPVRPVGPRQRFLPPAGILRGPSTSRFPVRPFPIMLGQVLAARAPVATMSVQLPGEPAPTGLSRRRARR